MKAKFLSCVASLLLVSTLVLLPAMAANATELNNTEDTTETTEGSTSSEESSTVPIVELSSYSIEGGMLTAGSEVTVNFELRNTSSSYSVSDCMMSVTSSSSMAYPVYGEDNQVYVGTIGAGKTKTVSLAISISPYFTAKSVDLTAAFSYRTNGTLLSNSSTIVIPSTGGNVVGIKSVDVASHAVVNGKSLISIDYVNQSTTDITDAKLLISGNVADGYQEITMPTIFAGKEYLKDYYVCFSETGNQEITVTLEYTDGNGETVDTEVGTYTITVSKDSNAADESKLELAHIKSLVGKLICMVFGVVALIAIVKYAKRH